MNKNKIKGKKKLVSGEWGEKKERGGGKGDGRGKKTKLGRRRLKGTQQ